MREKKFPSQFSPSNHSYKVRAFSLRIQESTANSTACDCEKMFSLLNQVLSNENFTGTLRALMFSKFSMILYREKRKKDEQERRHMHIEDEKKN